MSLAIFLIIRTQGHVTGQEFSPTDFQVRRFAFYEIPLLGLQITPIKRTGMTPDTARYVRQRNLIQTTPGRAPSWHLISISRGITGTTPGDAELLAHHLHLTHRAKAYWKQWSQDHPQHAKAFWPLIQRLAERELYVLMPPLFELAQLTAQSPGQLTAAIDSRLRTEYRHLIEDMRLADRPEVADELLREALNDYPDDPGLQQLDREPTQ